MNIHRSRKCFSNTQDVLKLSLYPCAGVSVTFPVLFCFSLHWQKDTDCPRTVFKEKKPLFYLIKKIGASICLTIIYIVKMIEIIAICTDWSFFSPPNLVVHLTHIAISLNPAPLKSRRLYRLFGNVTAVAGLVLKKKS